MGSGRRPGLQPARDSCCSPVRCCADWRPACGASPHADSRRCCWPSCAWPVPGLSLKDRGIAVGGALVGALVWVVPLLAASGGLGGYLAALGTQAGEDFSGVVMLWTTRQARVAVDAVLNFVRVAVEGPLDRRGVVMVACWAWPARVADAERFVLLMIAFGPYEIFHLAVSRDRPRCGMHSRWCCLWRSCWSTRCRPRANRRRPRRRPP